MPACLPKILVVDDSRMFLQVLVQNLRNTIDGQIFSASSLEETRTLLADHVFDVAMLDLNLPDAPQGEVVDLVLGQDVPVIVFAGDFSEQTRKRLWDKRIVDYVVKEGGESLQYAVRQARRVLRNRNIKVLVVEDSDMVRGMVAGLLRVHRFQVFEAAHGRDGLRVLAANPDIRLIITDYEMPGMDGVQFIRTVRREHPKEKVAILGISAHDQEVLTVRFLKSGANDFLTKPFSSEEFYCRITQNIDLLEYIQTIREYSEKDFLTGLYNRRYLFEQGPLMIKAARKQQRELYLAMLDIDHFKKINDQFGHETGDAILRDLGERLWRRFGAQGIPARLGGEEFCLLLTDEVNAPQSLEELRREISEFSLQRGADLVCYALSAGLCRSADANLETMLKHADAMLYRAKEHGRNRLDSCCVAKDAVVQK